MAFQPKVYELHAEMIKDICSHIDKCINEDEFSRITTFLKNSKALTPLETTESADMATLLDNLEKKSYFTIGDYSKLLHLFERFNQIVSRDVIQQRSNEIQEYIGKLDSPQETTNSSDDRKLGDESPSGQSIVEHSAIPASQELESQMNTPFSSNEIPFMETSSLKPYVAKSSLKTPISSSCDVETIYEKYDVTRFLESGEEITLSRILKYLELETYITRLQEEEYNVDDFWEITDDDLQGMGFKMAPKRRILKFIKDYKDFKRFDVASVTTTKDTLKPFQKELAERAIAGENTIVYARTNAGKTYIAFHIIANHLMKTASGKVVFLARTNILLQQQYSRAMDYFTSDKFHVFCLKAGDDFTDITVSQVFQLYNVLFMTPQLLVNILKDRRIGIEDLTLLILDECHHTFGYTPYNTLMILRRRVKYGKNLHVPQILGLTASPNIKRSKNVAEAINEISNLMANLDVVNISTVVREKDDYNKYFDDPQNVELEVVPRDGDPVSLIIIGAIETVEGKMREEAQKNMDVDDSEIYLLLDEVKNPPLDKSSPRYELWVNETSSKMKESKFGSDDVARFIMVCLDNLRTYYQAFQTNLNLEYKDVREYLEYKYHDLEHESHSDFAKEGEKELVTHMRGIIDKIPDRTGSNPDIDKVRKVLLEEFAQRKTESRFLVFVKERILAKRLASRLPVEIGCHYLTGSHAENDRAGMSTDEQEDAIQRFRSGEYKCLVATSVAFEGIDIPDCNLTIRYKVEANVINSLQMKGRIRKPDGTQYILGDDSNIRQEKLNIERQFIMNEAVEKIVTEKYISATQINNKQRELFHNEETKRITQSLSAKPTGQFEVHCHICQRFISDSQHFRNFKKHHHVVLDKAILATIHRLQTPKKRKLQEFDGFVKKNKIAGPCHHEWGSLLSYDNVDVVAIAVNSIRIYNVLERKYDKVIRKWEEFPFKISECTDEEWQYYKMSLSTSH